MASPIGYLTSCDETKYVETWIRCFATLARVKKLDQKTRKPPEGRMRLRVYFWLQQDVKPLRKLSIIVYSPTQLEDLTFGEISTFMKRNVLKKNLVIAERTKFFENRQNVNETVMQYLHKLKEATRYCKF